MNFNSLAFLLFLPVVILLYYIIPHRFRYILLLIASYYFYMSWNPWLIFLILGTTLASYLAGLGMEKTEKKGLKKFYLIMVIIVSVGALVFFKYFNFLIQSAIDFLNLFSLHIDSFSLNIILPIGISFYTFQTLSYVIDVYKGKIKAERHIGYYALFVCYFPQLVAGPIEKPQDLIPQLKEEHKFNLDDFLVGFRILLVGFFYKCAVADVLGIYVNRVFADVANANSLSLIFAGFLFSVQMYCDFAGYSEIATGAARMMGVRLSRNFYRPYMPTSYSDFFRRWHITLTRWFTEYIYIPLGGNRKGKARRILNTFIVFGLCGLWHGANWTYVLWGLYAAFFLSLESLIKKPIGKWLRSKGINTAAKGITAFRVVAMYALLIPACLIFRAESIEQIGQIFVKLFTTMGLGSAYFNATLSSMGMTLFGLVQVVVLCIGEVMIFHFGEIGRDAKEDLSSLPENQRNAIFNYRLLATLVLVLIISLSWVALLGSGAASEFQYFQF